MIKTIRIQNGLESDGGDKYAAEYIVYESSSSITWIGRTIITHSINSKKKNGTENVLSRSSTTRAPLFMAVQIVRYSKN